MGLNMAIQTVKITSDIAGYPGKDDAHYCVRFRGVTTRDYKGEDGYYVSDFWNYVAYGATARAIEKFFKKGSRLNAISEPRNNNSTGKDGTKYQTAEYVVNSFYFVDSAKPQDGGQPQQKAQSQQQWQQQAPASGWQPQQQAPAQQQWQPQQAAPQQQQWQQQAPAQQQWQQAPAQQAQQAPGFVANWDANASGLPFN